MATLTSSELEGKQVFSQAGRHVGSVDSLEVDTEGWRVTALRVKLARAVLEDLKLKRPLLGSQTVSIPVGEVAGVTDTLVLKSKVEDLAFLGGREAAD